MTPNTTSKRAIYVSASVLPAMFFVGQIVGQVLKHKNPANVDINQGLAYLQQILVSAFIVGLLLGVIALSSIVQSYRQGDSVHARIALRILLMQVVGFIILGLVTLVLPLAQ